MEENSRYDKKSLLCFSANEKAWDWNKITKHCVAFANARGGKLVFGIEDGEELPSPNQRIPENLGERLQKGIANHSLNVAVAPDIQSEANGGEVLVLKVLPSRQSVAATSDGRYFMRVSDESKPVMPEELVRLAGDRDAYVWELQTTACVPFSEANPGKKTKLLQDLKASKRVSGFIKEKDDVELLQHFSLIDDDQIMTNLGILWIGEQKDRKRLLYPPAIQFIKYDGREKKVAKTTWTDTTMNPKELIEAVWKDIPDWSEYTEIPNGLFRDTVPHYDEVVVRELLANALVHRPYTTRGDIFINLYPDHLEIHNPGLLPLGVTPQNILHQRVARNRYLAELFYALGLMEKEGSGYDTVYEILLSQARHVPEVREEYDRVVVSVDRRIIRPEMIDLIARVDESYQLTQRERISLGLIAQHGSLTALEFSKRLAFDDGTRIRKWLGRLEKERIVLSRGRTRGKEYRVNPEILRGANFKGPTPLKAIAPHRIRELVLADLTTYAPNPAKAIGIVDIHARVGKEIPRHKVKRALDRLIREGVVTTVGERRYRRYALRA